MPEPTVQVPVSLIERAIQELGTTHEDSIHPPVVEELSALLSQPTPTAEPMDVFQAEAMRARGQVPVHPSLPTREQIAEVRDVLNRNMWPLQWEDVQEARRLLAALLSQPTPTAEPWYCGRCGGSASEHARADSTCIWEPVPTPAAEPPRIEDMAPGTTFLARTSDGSLSHEDRLWMVTDSGDVISTRAHYILGRAIDPSTIRDVTPPTESTK